MKKFPYYTFKRKGVDYICGFRATNEIPEDVNITTPFTFPFSENNQVLLIFDKHGWWNPLGGHIEGEETWPEAMEREAKEEGGVEITEPKLFGYMTIEHNDESSPYPPKSVLPFTYSTIIKMLSDDEWEQLEVTERKFFTIKEAVMALEEREDNDLMLEIFNYLISIKKK